MRRSIEPDSPKAIREEALSRNVAYDRHRFLSGQDLVRAAIEQVKLYPNIDSFGRTVIQDAIAQAVRGALQAQAAIYDGPPTTRERLEELARSGNSGGLGDFETDKASLANLPDRFKRQYT